MAVVVLPQRWGAGGLVSAVAPEPPPEPPPPGLREVGAYVGAGNPDSLDDVNAALAPGGVQIAIDFSVHGTGSTWAHIENPYVIALWAGRGYKLVLAPAMFPGPHYYQGTPTHTLAAGAAGSYDSHWTALANFIVASGILGEDGIIIRPGHEFNRLNGFAWSTENVANGRTNYAAYFRRIVNAMRAVIPGLEFDWCTIRGHGGSTPNADPTTAYPGDSYVNYVGVDTYDYYTPFWADEVNDLDWKMAFAEAHSKPLTIPEWGLWVGDGSSTSGGGDDPTYIQNMHDWIAANDVAYACYFDFDTSGLYQFPTSEALYYDLFDGFYGGGSAELVEKAIGVATATAANSESFNPTRTPDKALDDDPASFWSSAWQVPSSQVFDVPRWWRADLLRVTHVKNVIPTWEESHAEDYLIQTSSDDVTFTTQLAVTGVTTEGRRVHALTADNVQARYVRIWATKRNLYSATNGWGIGLQKCEIEGVADSFVPPPPPDPPEEPPPGVGAPVSVMVWKVGNPYTTRLPDDAPLLPFSTQEARRSELTFGMNASSCGFEVGQWSATMWLVDGSTVKLADGTTVGTGQMRTTSGSGQSVIDNTTMPVRSEMTYNGGEGHVCVYNPSTGMYREFIKFGGLTANPGFSPGLESGWGAGCVDTRVRREQGDRLPGTTPGVNAPDYWNRGSIASGGSAGATLLLRHEMVNALAKAAIGDWANAYIPHTLMFEFYRHTPGTWEFPGKQTDWTGTGLMTPQYGVLEGECPTGHPGYPHPKVSAYNVGGCPNHRSRGLGVLPMGGIARLKYDYNPAVLTGLGLSTQQYYRARIIANTLMKHGMTLTDFTGAGFVINCERSSPGFPAFPDMYLNRSAGDSGAGASHESTNYAPWFKTVMEHWINTDSLVWVNTGPNPLGNGATREPGAYRPPGFDT